MCLVGLAWRTSSVSMKRCGRPFARLLTARAFIAVKRAVATRGRRPDAALILVRDLAGRKCDRLRITFARPRRQVGNAWPSVVVR